jgi:hypothetical protein
MYRVGAAVEGALDQRRGYPLLDDARGLGDAPEAPEGGR